MLEVIVDKGPYTPLWRVVDRRYNYVRGIRQSSEEAVRLAKDYARVLGRVVTIEQFIEVKAVHPDGAVIGEDYDIAHI